MNLANRLSLAVTLCGAVLSVFRVHAQILARWSFDDAPGAGARESVSGTDDPIGGYNKRVPGVSGQGLRFDGLTTHLVRTGRNAPVLGEGFTVEAWVALDHYPWNWLPVIQQSVAQQSGFFFGLDAFGHVGLQVAVDGVWQSVTSSARLPLKKWAHIAGAFDGRSGLRIYINGVEAGRLAVEGRMIPALRADVLIGRVPRPTLTYPSYFPMHPVLYSLDGILDELSLYTGAAAPDEIRARYAAVRAPEGEVLRWPALPSGPPGPGPFGAYYTTLHYDEVWESARRIGPDSDVLVRFGELPMRLVFWQGMNYIPAWVTENGKWYTDEFLEVYGDLEGCPDGADCEPISDKQSRYSRVRILESTDARAVIHWRYALNEGVNYKGAHPDPLTGWFDWGDEYWTVYPDGVAVRKQVLWTTHPAKTHEFQETIIINAPGQKPEDNIHLDALWIANMKGEVAKYSWSPKLSRGFERTRGPDRIDKPANGNIQLVNVKSAWKPFQIVPPEKASFDVYNTTSYFTFGCWNHWPVAQIVSANRPCVDTDRVSHSSFSHIFWEPYAQTGNSVTKLLLNGLTTRSAGELVPLAKSWLSPPRFEAVGRGFRVEKYDPAERAYIVERESARAGLAAEFVLQASTESPVINPSVVIRHWNDQRPRIEIDGAPVAWSKDCRAGLNERLDRTDLVLWIRKEATAPVRLRLAPTG